MAYVTRGVRYWSAAVCCVINRGCCYNAFRGFLPGFPLCQDVPDWSSAAFGSPRANWVPTTIAIYYLITKIAPVLYNTYCY